MRDVLIIGGGVVGLSLAWELRSAIVQVQTDAELADLARRRPSIVAIAQDKKVVRGALTFILTHGIGQAFIEKNVDPAAVRIYLDEMRKA